MLSAYPDMAPDRNDRVAPPDDRRSETTTETSTTTTGPNGGGITLPPASSLLNSIATGGDDARRGGGPDGVNSHHNTIRNSTAGTHAHAALYTDGAFSQSDPRSADGSQASNATTVPDQVFTPTHTTGPGLPLPPPSSTPTEPSGPDSQLLQLSELAAGQQRMRSDSSARKRTADGLVKSPVRGGGHSRTTSSVSVLSTTSTIGEVSRARYKPSRNVSVANQSADGVESEE